MTKVAALLDASAVHADWRPVLEPALQNLQADYVEALLSKDDWLPGRENLLAAFRRDLCGLRYLLIGESPYPRRESANGIAFYDAAVGDIWSPQGLSKAVNRATSLRNLIKTAVLAEGLASLDDEGRLSQAAIAAIDKNGLIQQLKELFANLEQAGFLLLNATPVLHPQRKPVREARYWNNFLEQLLSSIAAHAPQPVTLVLWGKIAGLVESMPASADYRQLVCEHPYNLSFITNPQMQGLFGEIRVLQQTVGSRTSDT